MRRFGEVCRRRGLKVNTYKRKVMMFSGEKGLGCDIHVDGTRLEQVSEFKYLGCVLNESGTDNQECRRNVESGMKVEGFIRSLVNDMCLQLDCTRVLHEGLLVPVLLYGSKTIIWREKERLRIRSVQMNNLRGLLAVRRIDRVQHTWIRKLCRVAKGVAESIDESVLRWLRHNERMENHRIAKRVYMGEFVGNHLVGSDRLIP